MSSKGNLVDFLEQFETKHNVHQENFSKYIEKQFENDKKQDEFSRNRFEVTQSKLDAIINQQVAYTEQLKAYNGLLINYQKQLDNINDRLLYIERGYKKNPQE
jgi:hypothetical protein